MLGDVILALVDNGIAMDDLEVGKEIVLFIYLPLQFHFQKFTFRTRTVIVNFSNDSNNEELPLSKNLPLPKKYTYERTSAFVKPPTDIKLLRHKAAICKVGTQRALAKFYVRTSKSTLNLLGCDDNKNKRFLISNDKDLKSKTPAYLTALYPTDQIFDFEELEYYYQLQNAKIEEGVAKSGSSSARSYGSKSECDYIEFDVSPSRRESQEEASGEVVKMSSQSESSSKQRIENPYLKFIQ